MPQPLQSQVQPQDGVLPTVPMQRRVQFLALLQVAERCTVNLSTIATVCPGTDRRDLESALGYLLDEGSLSGPTWRLQSLVDLARGGLLTLTESGQRWLEQGED